MKVITNFGVGQTPAQNNATFNAPSQQTTILDATNPMFLRNIILSNNGVKLVRATTQAGIQTNQIIQAMLSLEPTLTWPPIINPQPSNVAINAPTTTANYSFAASGEYDALLPISYQWQLSTNNGANWSNVPNSGVYSGPTTNNLAISNVLGIQGTQYRAFANSNAGSNVTNTVTLVTVDPWFSPISTPVTANNGAAANIISNGHGYTAISYQWFSAQNNATAMAQVNNGGVYSNATTNTLHISNVAGLNGYFFMVQGTDNNGVANSGNVQLIVV